MAEEAHQGSDVATLEVVIEAAGPLTHGQLEGLGVRTAKVHPEVVRLSHPPMAVAVQLPIVVG